MTSDGPSVYTGREARRNFQKGVLNGLLFTLAETLLDPTLVLVAFVSSLTDAPLWIGLVTPLRDGAWFLPQLWISGYVQSQPRKLPLYRRMAAVRVVAWFLLVVATFTLTDRRALLVAFFITFGIYALAAGFGGLSFLEVVGKTIPPHRRPSFFAWRMLLGGLASLGASALVRWLLSEGSPLPFPYNFGALFAVALPFAAAGLFVFSRITEPAESTVKARASLMAQLREAARIVQHDRNYRRFLALRAALLIAGAAIPFFAVYVQQTLGGALDMVGVYLAVYTLAYLLANVVLGRYALRLGHRRTLQIGAWAGLGMTGLVLLLAFSAQPLGLSGAVASFVLIPVFALSGLREAGMGVSAQSLLLDIAPPTERSLYLGFTNSFLGVVLLSTGLSGLIVEQWGVQVLMLIALAANVGALIAAQQMHDVLPASEKEPALAPAQ